MKVCATPPTTLRILTEFFCFPVKCTHNLHSYFAERLHYAMKVTFLSIASLTVCHICHQLDNQEAQRQWITTVFNTEVSFILISWTSERFKFSGKTESRKEKSQLQGNLNRYMQGCPLYWTVTILGDPYCHCHPKDCITEAPTQDYPAAKW